MGSKRIVLAVLVALVPGATACTDDPVEPEDTLTEEESVDMFTGFRGLLALEDPVVVSQTENGAVIECPLGGRAEAEIHGEDEEEFAGDTVRLNLEVTINPMGCVVAENGAEFTLTGDPNIREQISAEIVGFFESFDITGTTVGGLAWEYDGRSGSCNINLVLTAEPDLSNPDDPSLMGTLTGMLCGHDVTIDLEDLPIG